MLGARPICPDRVDLGGQNEVHETMGRSDGNWASDLIARRLFLVSDDQRLLAGSRKRRRASIKPLVVFQTVRSKSRVLI